MELYKIILKVILEMKYTNSYVVIYIDELYTTTDSTKKNIVHCLKKCSDQLSYRVDLPKNEAKIRQVSARTTSHPYRFPRFGTQTWRKGGPLATI